MSGLEFSDERIPLAYFLTFRSYGTWLHGRAGSVDRSHNVYGTSRLTASRARLLRNRRLLKQPPVILSRKQRNVILASIKDTCDKRKWKLWTANIRSNHVHSVVSASKKPLLVLNALKANATRKLKEEGLWQSELSPWARRGSRRWLWTEEALSNAIAYVMYEQGED